MIRYQQKSTLKYQDAFCLFLHFPIPTQESSVKFYDFVSCCSKMAVNKLAAAGYKVIELNTGFLSWDGEVEK